MDDLITLSCPSCGGQLKIESNQTNYTCYYCGQQHRLRIEDVEEYGRCPICRRNDKVEKVRAIQHKKGNLSVLLAPPKDPEKALNYQPKSKPKPLEKPTLYPGIIKSEFTKYSKVVFIISIALIILFIILVSKNATRFYPVWFLLFGFIGLILSFVFYIKGTIDGKKLNKAYQDQLISTWLLKNEQIKQDWTEYIKKYDDDFHQKAAMMKEKYSKAMKRYELLYYCHRDDCVFIPGESGFAPSGKFQEFLFTDSHDNGTAK